MSLHFLTYDAINGKRNMTWLIQRNADQARAFGIFASVLISTPAIFQGSMFYAAHKSILDSVKGAGYWLWKPYTILKRLLELPEGDILFYLDGDCTFQAKPTVFENQAKKHGLSLIECHPRWSIKAMTKRDCLILLDADKEPILSAPQVWAAAVTILNNAETRGFVLDWLLGCCNADILIDGPSHLAPDYPMIQHRWDQSVLSILARKQGRATLRNEYANQIQHHSCTAVKQ